MKPGGVVVNVAIWAESASMNMSSLVLKEIDLCGTIAHTNNHPAVIKLVQDIKVALATFITAKIEVERLVHDGFDTVIRHKDTAVKILVHP